MSVDDLYSPSNIIPVINPRRMPGAGHVAFMWGKEKCILDFGGENLRERYHLEDLGVCGG